MDARPNPPFGNYAPVSEPDTAPVIFAEGITAIGASSGLFHARLEMLVHELDTKTGLVVSRRKTVAHLRLPMQCAADVKAAITMVQQLKTATPGTG